jgi:hypothetical protein
VFLNFLLLLLPTEPSYIISIMKKILFLLIVFSQTVSAQKKNKAAPETLLNCWSRSFEDDKEKTVAMRNCDFNFPPRMYRPSVKLESNGVCQILHIGETDIRSFEPGTWTYNKCKKRVTVTNKNNLVEMKFKIKKIETNYMDVIWEM